MEPSRDQMVIILQKDIHSHAFEQFVEDYNPFIISCVSKRLDRYVNYENDPAYSVALDAFCNAIQKYQIDKGSFISFAKVVIDHALINYMKTGERTHENIDDITLTDSAMAIEDQLALKEEIQLFERDLLRFGIDFDDLADNTPRHKDTKIKAKEIAIATQQVRDFVAHLFEKLRLPVNKMCQRFAVTRKIIYGSYDYIVAIIIILENKYDLIKKWI